MGFTTKTPINIQHDKYKKHLNNVLFWSISILWACVYGLFVLGVFAKEIAPVYLGIHAVWTGAIAVFIWAWSNRYNTKYINNLRYEMDEDSLIIQKGVYNTQHITIPLDSIAEVVMTQDANMKKYDIWRLDVHTMTQSAHGTMSQIHAVGEPKFVRHQLLEARKKAKARLFQSA